MESVHLPQYFVAGDFDILRFTSIKLKISPIYATQDFSKTLFYINCYT
jgi:hypothetical protein